MSFTLVVLVPHFYSFSTVPNYPFILSSDAPAIFTLISPLFLLIATTDISTYSPTLTQKHFVHPPEPNLSSFDFLKKGFVI